MWHFVVSYDGRAGERKQKSLHTWPEGGGRLLVKYGKMWEMMRMGRRG